ncbi:hypothetical protein Poli38472_012252 [Pythium oligandrum]|uniref:Vacuolar protein sorting-associated protein 35 n=1 Tax=Pythium oligandrum TaxID=41045 RepID=A0A8K1CPX6_PYTOL|nr:hypothetical protein Poli38472_014953 [Pythium oligandrum]TMW67136.1 hypothetical protein Poli38472_012252 [Pythium oligandrum]|eukprot:TMW66566.1 hypothetical protein Poli38472_014953 [Pythium oligandrum]
MASTKSFVLDAQGQEDLLQEALRNVRDHAFRMKRAMDAGELSNVLKHAAEVLRELRTSLLSPKNYYQLYMQVLDELRHLEAYVEDLHKSGTSIRSLYERVQSSGNVLPRLYLLVTVGAVYIKSKDAPAREVLMDLVEMTKGVQHPLRGLFLRNYLSISVKDKLPDVGSEYEGAGGGIDDAVAFLLKNFSETNRLWIRMQNQKAGIVKDKSTREKERQDLRLLVGTSLVRLSQLDGMTAHMYATEVLPKLTEIIIECKDKIAQEYLMDCVIQVFPDDFHLQNLNQLLRALGELHEGVDSAKILVTLLERLTKYKQENASDKTPLFGDNSEKKTSQEDVFAIVMAAVEKLTSATTQSASMLLLFETLTSFTLTCFDPFVAFIGQVTYAARSYLLNQSIALDTSNESDSSEGSHVKRMMLSLLEHLSLTELRSIEAISDLTKLLPWKTTRKALMLEWIQILFRRNERATTTEDVEFLMDLLAPLVRDDPDDHSATVTDSTKNEVEGESLQVSKLVHLMSPASLDVQFQMHSIARRAFGQGGVYRIRHTLLPLIFASLCLARELEMRKEEFTTSSREVLQFVHEMVTALASKVDQLSVTCVNLFLQCALVADRCQFEAVAYEFITQAFIVYEDQITHSRDQWKALELMVTSVRATTNLSEANYEVLATKTTQYAAKLLKKVDQAAMVLNCAHLFWHPCHKDGKRVLECLQRSLRIADASGGGNGSSAAAAALTQVPLFLDILDAYLYFYEAKTPEVTVNYLNGLLALVREHVENMEHGVVRSESEIRYRDIRRYMDSKAIVLS